MNDAQAVAALLGVSCPRGALSLVWSSAVQFVTWHSLHILLSCRWLCGVFELVVGDWW